MLGTVVASVESLQPYLQASKDGKRLDLYLKGIKCNHCVHKVTKEIEGLQSLNGFEFSSGGNKLSLWSNQSQTFADVMGRISSLGFEPIPLTADTDHATAREIFKSDLKKLAVAGVCAGNIMLFSTAVYLGADAEFSRFFHKLSFFLVLPPMIYSASSIWRGLLQSLRSFRFNLDLPIGLALSLGMGMSLVSLLTDQKHIYFDSLAVVVFLILASRFVLKRYVANVQLGHWVQLIPGVWQARVVTKAGDDVRALDRVQVGDSIRVYRGEVVPVDGTLLSATAVLDEAVLSGESSPVLRHQGEKIFAGSKLCVDQMLVETQKVAADTRVGRTIQQSQSQQKKAEEESFQFVAYFTSFVLLASLATFLSAWYFIDLAAAYQRAFAIVLVACPCAISFGIPLIRSFSGKLALDNGLIVKQPEVLKRMARVKNLFFDKTGTLTQDTMAPVMADLETLSTTDQQKVFSLELAMDHPISNGFRRVKPKGLELLPVQNFQYHPGRGISGEVAGEHWTIETDQQSRQKSLIVARDGQVLGSVRLQPRLKDNLSNFFRNLTQKGYKISILSGDKQSEVEPIKDLIPIAGQGRFLWGATAGEKVKALQEVGADSMMVGDGVNDIEAMGAADLSLCMPGALENNLNLADGVLTRGDLATVENVFRLAKKILLTERRLLGFTFTYNVLCILAAATGWITPVVAAILMPISSIVVLSLVTLGLRRL